jgi:hypothetical protein
MNDWLHWHEGMPVIAMDGWKEGKVLITIPREYFRNTYNISLLSLIIRLMNVAQVFESFEDVIKEKDFYPKDQNLWDQVVAKGVFFNLPEHLKKFVWYYDANNNSETKKEGYNIPSLVHNCGVLAWSKGF